MAKAGADADRPTQPLENRDAMTTLVALLNGALTSLFSLVYTPLKWLGPLWSLVVISLLAGILLVWIFGQVSNQSAIASTRNRLSSELMAGETVSSG